MLESRHFSATGYLFIYAAFYYAFVSSACTRRLSPLPPSIPAVGSIANSLLIFFFFVKKKFKRKNFRYLNLLVWKIFDRIFCSFSCILFHDSGVECEFWTFEFVYNLIRQILRIKLKLKFWEFIRELTIFLPLPVRLQ